jgi:cytochrome c oxidase subunit 3
MAPAVLDQPLRDTEPGAGAPPAARDGGFFGDGRPDGDDGVLGDTKRVGLFAFLGTVTMLFLGFTSALLLRRASTDWQRLAPPSLLALSSGALVLSSVALEIGRRRLRALDLRAAEQWTWATGLLGAVFVAVQFLAWRQLQAAGVFLASNPSSSFFYVLTGVHIVHVLGGLAWFGLVTTQMRRMAFLPGEDGLALFATYWHYLAALWLYLLYMLFLF